MNIIFGVPSQSAAIQIQALYNAGNPLLRLFNNGAERFRFNMDSTPTFRIGGNQLLKERITGWSAPVGTAARTGFDTTATSLQEIAEHLKALIDDATTHGFIGT